MSFLNKIKLTNKKVYILGGSGLIGSKVVINTLSVGAKVIILDIKKKQIQKNVKYERFDCSKLKTLEKNFDRIIKKLGFPDVFINCSYPRTNDWDRCSFNTINLKRKSKLVKGRKTFKSGYKKAIITLQKGQSIDLTTGI